MWMLQAREKNITWRIRMLDYASAKPSRIPLYRIVHSFFVRMSAGREENERLVSEANTSIWGTASESLGALISNIDRNRYSSLVDTQVWRRDGAERG
jgi:hypothetical protein